MADPKLTDFIPPELRSFAEKSVQQAQKAFDDMMGATQRAVSTFEGQANAAKDFQRKVLTFSERNVASSLEFAQKLLQAKDTEDVLKLHADYVKSQMQTLGEQAKELAQHANPAGRSST